MIEFHRLAADELRRAQTWYRERSLSVALRFLARTTYAVERIALDPWSYAKLGSNWHYVPISPFPFILIYRIRSENIVLIVAVAHTARRTGYWRNRQ